jgi:hypothetical protein
MRTTRLSGFARGRVAREISAEIKSERKTSSRRREEPEGKRIVTLRAL